MKRCVPHAPHPLSQSCVTMFLSYRLQAKSLKSVDRWKQFLDYRKALIKQENNFLRITFIEKCKQADIIPRFLKFCIPNNGCFEQTVVHNFQLRLSKEELSNANQNEGKALQECGGKEEGIEEHSSIEAHPLSHPLHLYIRIQN